MQEGRPPDGSTPIAAVNLKVPDLQRLAQVRVFSAQGVADGPHTLRVVNGSTDYVAVDAFSVTGADEEIR